MNFGSHVEGIVAVSAALINAGTPGERQGRDHPLPPVAVLVESIGDALAQGGRRAVHPSRARVRDYVDLAGSARPVFSHLDDGDHRAAAGAVNSLLDRYRPSPILEAHDGEPWHLHFHGPRASDPTGWGGAVAMGLATVLGSEYADRLGVCAAPVCDRVFVDISRNGTRRFCSETCQSRVKAAAHRARQRG